MTMTPSGDLARPDAGDGRWFAGTANPAARCWLLCLPHAGGGATTYLSWERLLPAGLGLRAVQPPGREARLKEPLHRDARSLVRAMLPAVETLADRPLVLFGHSLGAIVAYELAREMRRAGLPAPAHLYLSGRQAPHLTISHRETWNLTDEGLVALLRRLGGTLSVVLDDPDLRSLFLPVLRADLEMNERYAYVEENPLAVPITAFAATDDERATPGEVAEWAAHTTSRFGLVTVDGGHFTVMARPEIVIDRMVADAGTWI
jgi:medium-chain acyl-[acyl-carrier-protein] hydrolase